MPLPLIHTKNNDCCSSLMLVHRMLYSMYIHFVLIHLHQDLYAWCACMELWSATIIITIIIPKSWLWSVLNVREKKRWSLVQVMM